MVIEIDGDCEAGASLVHGGLGSKIDPGTLTEKQI